MGALKSLRNPVFILSLAVLMVYVPTLFFDFVRWDDYLHVVENPALNPPSWQSLVHFWTVGHAGLYIPLAYTAWTGLSWLSLRVTGGYHLRPPLFHLANLILHLLNSVLAYLVLRSLLKAMTRKADSGVPASGVQRAALAGSLLFALHPLQVEAVAWVSGLRDLLCGFFSLLSIHLYFRRDGSDRARVPLAFLCSVLAMLAKPAAIGITAVLAWLEWGLEFGPGPEGFREFIRSRGPRFLRWLLVLTPLVLLAKSLQPSRELAFVPGWGERVLVAGDATTFYLLKLFVPLHLIPEYRHAPLDILGTRWVYATAVAPFALLILLIGRRSLRFLIVPFGVFGLALLPVLGFVPFGYQTYSTVADRYAYLAMLGAGLALALLVIRIGERRWLALATWAGLAILGTRSFLQVFHWRDSRHLSRHTLRYNPESYGAHLNLGIDLKDTDLDAAIRQFEFARSLRPREPGVYVNLGSAYATRGDYRSAESRYEQALALDPKTPSAHMNLAKLLVILGKIPQSGHHFEEAVRLDPSEAFEAHSWAGDALLRAGYEEAAALHLKQAIELRPDIPALHNELGVALVRHGLVRQARAEFQEALRLDPADPEARQNLARALAMDGGS